MKIRREVSRPDGHVDSTVVEVTADSSIGRMFAGQGAARAVEVTHKTGWVTTWTCEPEDADLDDDAGEERSYLYGGIE